MNITNDIHWIQNHLPPDFTFSIRTIRNKDDKQDWIVRVIRSMEHDVDERYPVMGEIIHEDYGSDLDKLLVGVINHVKYWEEVYDFLNDFVNENEG